MDTDFVEFQQTLEGRGFLLLGYFLFKSHENGFGCYEAGKGHGFRFQEMELMHDEGGCPWTAHRLMWDC